MTPDAQYPIRAVARLTGLSIDTLRAWERRYGAVEPTRGERGRLYSEEHITRLKQLASLVERGHAIGTIAAMPDEALRRLANEGRPRAASNRGASADLTPLLTAVKAYDLEAIESHLARLAVLLTPRDFVLLVAMPVLHEVGTRWDEGSVRPAQEHLVSAILRSVLGGVLRAMPRRSGAPRMVFATLPGERHELGLLSAAVLAAAAGAYAIYLGPDLPGADLAHAMNKSGARVLVLAATTPGAVDGDDLRALRKLPDGAAIWIGGPQAGTIKDHIGTHAVAVTSLDSLQGMVNQLAA